MSAPAFLERVNKITRDFMESKLVLSGVELKLFDRLAEGAATVDELVGELQVTARGIEILADALVACGYLEKRGAAYANSADVDRYLVRGRPDAIAFITGHHNQMFRSWAQLDEIIRHGKQTRDRDKATLSDRETNRNFILGMAEVSRERIGPILERLPLEGARRFVDLGGGPAHYPCEAARRWPELRSLLIDLPLTVEVAQGFIAEAGLTDRVDTLVCDFYREDAIPIDEPADVVLISQVLHAEGPDQNRALLRKVTPLVRSGGVVAVVENLVDESRVAPRAAAMFAVNMLAGTARGRTYTAAEVQGWLREAGLEPGPAEQIAERTWIILARKPA